MTESRREQDLVWERYPEALGLLVRGATVRVALPTMLVVGTILSVVNQAAVLIDGEANWGTWVRIAINYLVPFLVASVGFLAAHRRRS